MQLLNIWPALHFPRELFPGVICFCIHQFILYLLKKDFYKVIKLTIVSLFFYLFDFACLNYMCSPDLFNCMQLEGLISMTRMKDGILLLLTCY